MKGLLGNLVIVAGLLHRGIEVFFSQEDGSVGLI